jgi:hypothetical protein
LAQLTGLVMLQSQGADFSNGRHTFGGR